ncbi:cytochrome-c peroxidase [Photobacterium proteolyticum]|uniref:Methylamine utilization protein MauG n=1 Tax=Photobacterium proteolyticum TaxID=1903952 RepID=A0A1Q9GLN4_9GAMM|nr:cytochrome c peroxidase [Photobacterium proteolyticum]OLQ75451.1 cytochrome-c peroxidase [Photobacterium proteolyticum]
MKSSSLTLGAASIAASLLLSACNGSGSDSAPVSTQPSTSTSTPELQQLDRSPKAQVTQGGVFTYKYQLKSDQTLRVIEPPKFGRVVINGGALEYQAPQAETGADAFRLELVGNDDVVVINWLLRVNQSTPRFTQSMVNDPSSGKTWQCVTDTSTHLGVTWATTTQPNQQTFAWKDWDATLPHLGAQCFLGDGECNTDALIAHANQNQWCGKSDWRLPFAYEMKNLTSEQDFALDRNQAAIDPYFFADVGFEYYWLATDASDEQVDNLAHRYSFGTKRNSVSNQNKRQPASVMLVSGEYRDPSLPNQQVEPQSEATSFIRLNDQGLPIDRALQQNSYQESPWRCLDDMRSLVRDNLFLRDGRFSYVYWLTPGNSDITNTAHTFALETSVSHCEQSTCTLDEMVKQVNALQQCGRGDWRVPSQEELALLLHQKVDGGEFELLYQASLNQPEAGNYWVSTKSGYATLSLPHVPSLTPVAAAPNQRAKLLLIASEFEPRATEDPRSVNNHGRPNMTKLRLDYATSPENWPAPFVDDMSEYQELGVMPLPEFPNSNPYQASKVELGKKLFFDPFLSRAQDVSCASCHDPQKGWTDNLEVSIGHDRQRGKRNAPTVVNSAFLPVLFWDGRAKDLEQQALMPIQDPLEMAETLPRLVERLNAHPTYPAQFDAVFNQGAITAEQLGMALATFQRTIVSNESKLDRFVKQAPLGNTDALSDQELWGLDIYRRNGRCANCHMGPELTNHAFENVGLTYYKAFYEDLGQYNVDGKSESVGKFKTPSLRDVMNTGPWFHNGLVHTMDGVISMYSEGMASNAPFGWSKYDPNYPKLSEKIRPLNLTYQEAEALIAFMNAITADSPQQPASQASLGQ